MHIYQLLPYVLSTSFSTHPKRQTWDKKRPPFYIFRHYATYRKLRKKISKKFFSQFLVFWELLLFFLKRVPNSPILWHFQVLLLFLSLRYGADLGRSRLVPFSLTFKENILNIKDYIWLYHSIFLQISPFLCFGVSTWTHTSNCQPYTSFFLFTLKYIFRNSLLPIGMKSGMSWTNF